MTNANSLSSSGSIGQSAMFFNFFRIFGSIELWFMSNMISVDFPCQLHKYSLEAVNVLCIKRKGPNFCVIQLTLKPNFAIFITYKLCWLRLPEKKINHRHAFHLLTNSLILSPFQVKTYNWDNADKM